MARPRKQTLDEIVTRNALMWVRRRVAARKLENKSYTLNALADEMAPHLVPTDEMGDSAANAIGKTVARYLGIGTKDKTPWRLDYLDAFCRALGVLPRDMLTQQVSLSDEDLQRLHELSKHATWLPPWDPRSAKNSD